MAAKMDSSGISKITEKEKEITHQDDPVKGGPTAQAQKHAGEAINSEVLHDITTGEKEITGGYRIKGGPTSTAQSMLAKGTSGPQNPTLDSNTISHITEGEKTITGSDDPIRGGPTAMAQKHAGEPLNSTTLHDITEGEKKLTGSDAVRAGGPTAAAQSEVGKSRQ